MLGCPGGVSLALDGVVDGRSTVQGGRTGPDTYRQSSTQSDVGANQRVPLAGGFQLRFDGHTTRELFDSRLGALRNRLDRRTNQANGALGFNRKRGSFELSTQVFDQKTSGAGAEIPYLERRQAGATAEIGFGRFRASGYGLFIASRRELLLYPKPTRDREWSGAIDMRSGIRWLGDLGYRLSGFTDRSLDFHSRSTNVTQTITFARSARFGGGRGLAAVKTTSGFFSQTQTVGTAGSGMRLIQPHTGGFLLDDTPELHDPLEPDVTPVAELYDGNRSSATLVQIGDSAPAVRQFGGDYRNISFDFGEAIQPDSVVIYVDRTLVSADFFRWRVFVSNDPDGRRWDEVTGARITYTEWGIGLQGWSVILSQPVSARFFKVVDVKLGPTIADLSVSELEVFTKSDQVTSEDRSNTTSHRVGLSLGYDLSASLHAGYDLTYRRRTLSGQSTPLNDVAHGFGGSWVRGIWALTGRYETRDLEGQRARSTRARTQNVTLKRGQGDGLISTLSWSRIRDLSPGVEKTSNGVSLGAVWNPAPALRINQRVTGARLNDQAAGKRSTSLVVVTSVIGEPTPSMSLDLEESERWVSEEAGTGFSRFDDTSLTLGWRPVPLISLQSMVRYQVRDRRDWLTTNSVTWEALSGGTFKAGLSAHHFRDTRAQETERGGGIQVEWAARSNLTILGSVEAVVVKSAQQEDAPLNTEIRGIWRY